MAFALTILHRLLLQKTYHQYPFNKLIYLKKHLAKRKITQRRGKEQRISSAG